MNDTIPKDILPHSADITLWMWVSLIELAMVAFLLYKLWKRNSSPARMPEFDKKNLKPTDSANVGMDNLVNSITKAQTLYKELSKKYHPDRFIGTPLHGMAQEIFQKITEHKKNYHMLSLLKEEAGTKLNSE